MNKARTPDQRARALLNASTLQQKYRWLVEQPANSPNQTTFSGVTYPQQVPCTPTVVYTDGPDGVRFTDGVTAFPSQIALASTWDKQLAYVKGATEGAEAFDKGKNVVLGPGLESGRTLCRDARLSTWARISFWSERLLPHRCAGCRPGTPTSRFSPP